MPTRETSVRLGEGAGGNLDPDDGPDGSPRRGPEFDVESITPPETGRPVSVPVNCGAKEVVAQVKRKYILESPSQEVHFP